MQSVMQKVLRVGGEMALAAERGRAGRRQMIQWAFRLQEAAAELERRARGD
jgi:hypothetical protein